MKIFTIEQIRDWDTYTIENERIAPIDLMERAAEGFVSFFSMHNSFVPYGRLHIFCGSGNNGGDGMAIARIMAETRSMINVYHIPTSSSPSEDFETNVARLIDQNKIERFSLLDNAANFPIIERTDIIIDAILGAGLKKNLNGFLVEVVEFINASTAKVWSVDVPSGMFSDKFTAGVSVEADRTIRYETPKLAFFFAENERRIGKIELIDIGLSMDYYQANDADYEELSIDFFHTIIPYREKFSSKGTYRHALLMAGSYGKMGAAVLAAKACLRTGVGLLTSYAPKCGYEVLQTAVPEAMFIADPDIWQITQPPHKEYDVIGIGPGIGTSKETVAAFEKLLKSQQKPMVIDADALNILGYYPELQAFIPKNSILTPHLKEFERLFGVSQNSFERNQLQREKAQELGVIIVLKGAHSSIALPSGKCYFNITGNPGMATAGSGDVLTGILTALLSQKYSPENAALWGVFLHGMAGDLASETLSQEALIASDIVQYIGNAYNFVRDEFIQAHRRYFLDNSDELDF